MLVKEIGFTIINHIDSHKLLFYIVAIGFNQELTDSVVTDLLALNQVKLRQIEGIEPRTSMTKPSLVNNNLSSAVGAISFGNNPNKSLLIDINVQKAKIGLNLKTNNIKFLLEIGLSSSTDDSYHLRESVKIKTNYGLGEVLSISGNKMRSTEYQAQRSCSMTREIGGRSMRSIEYQTPRHWTKS